MADKYRKDEQFEKRSTAYGVRFPNSATRVPIAYRATRIPDDVMEYLAECPVFNLDCGEELLSHGFSKCVDYPHIPNHIYYEGYWHALRGSVAPFMGLNPRTGRETLKPSAPLQVSAFIEAFREINATIWNEILDSLPRESYSAAMFQKLIQSGAHFADIACQVGALPSTTGFSFQLIQYCVAFLVRFTMATKFQTRTLDGTQMQATAFSIWQWQSKDVVLCTRNSHHRTLMTSWACPM